MKMKDAVIAILAFSVLPMAMVAPARAQVKSRRVVATGKLAGTKSFWGSRERFPQKIKDFMNKDGEPRGFEWVRDLSALHYKLFICGLNDAYKQACLDDDWDSVMAFVESWYMASRVDSDAALKASLMREHDPSDCQEMLHPHEYREKKEKAGKR